MSTKNKTQPCSSMKNKFIPIFCFNGDIEKIYTSSPVFLGNKENEFIYYKPTTGFHADIDLDFYTLQDSFQGVEASEFDFLNPDGDKLRSSFGYAEMTYKGERQTLMVMAVKNSAIKYFKETGEPSKRGIHDKDLTLFVNKKLRNVIEETSRYAYRVIFEEFIPSIAEQEIHVSFETLEQINNLCFNDK